MGFLLSAVSFLCYFTVIGNAQDSARLYPAAIYKDHLADPYVLSELPLSALLKVKKSVNNIICSGFLRVPQVDETCRAEDLEITSNHNSVKNSTQDPASSRTLTDIKEFFLGSNTPSTNVQDNRKTYYESHSGGGDSGHGVWKGSESSGKIQKLFQFSVTALAFLAFGGYLLCMIVQAIKSKGTVYYNPYATTGASAIKKKKPIFSYGKRRRRRQIGHGQMEEDKEVSTTSPVAETDLDMMYNGLISAIGAYVKLYAPV